jgi:hypothetical protein
MITRQSLIRRLALGSFVGCILTAFLVICLVGLGTIKPGPTLGIISFVCGALTWLGTMWRWARRRPPA